MMATKSTYKCAICQTAYASNRNLQRHLGSHISNKYFCCTCETAYAYDTGLARHMRKQHGGVGTTATYRTTDYVVRIISHLRH